MSKLSWRLVDRYFAGRATPAERALVEQWLAGSPAFRMLVEELYRGGLKEDAVRQAQAEVQNRLERDRASRRTIRRQVAAALGARGRMVLAAAAAVALLLGGTIVARKVVNLQHAKAGLLTVVTAPNGQRTPVSLPDGSQIILSPGSTLRYTANGFEAAAQREVALVGEAYFDVDHDERRPFVVRAGDLVAKDLGTEFVIRAYPEDANGRVIVRSGLVGVAGAIVRPGQLGRLGAGGKPVVEPADTTSWFAWTRGRLVFDRMPLREALPKLSRWYDLEFKLADPSLGDIVLVAALSDQTADDALDVIALALGLRQERVGRVVTFSRRGA